MLEKSIKFFKSLFVFTLTITFIFFIFSLIYSNYIKEEEIPQENISEQESKHLIVLISLDGFGSNLIGENSPYIVSLMQNPNTSYTLDMQTLLQSETMPSHVSMITGLSQENHGISFNSVDSSTPTLSIPTIFDYVLENEYTYYAFFTKEKLLYLVKNQEGENIKYVDGYSNIVGEDIDRLIESNDENIFIFIHLKDLDSYGHTYGWGSEKQLEMLRELDEYIQIFKEDLDREFNNYERQYILTADHGGEGTQHSNGCTDCRRIPLILINEEVEEKYILEEKGYNIYDVTCVVLDVIMDIKVSDLDCVQMKQ